MLGPETEDVASRAACSSSAGMCKTTKFDNSNTCTHCSQICSLNPQLETQMTARCMLDGVLITRCRCLHSIPSSPGMSSNWASRGPRECGKQVTQQRTLSWYRQLPCQPSMQHTPSDSLLVIVFCQVVALCSLMVNTHVPALSGRCSWRAPRPLWQPPAPANSNAEAPQALRRASCVASGRRPPARLGSICFASPCSSGVPLSATPRCEPLIGSIQQVIALHGKMSGLTFQLVHTPCPALSANSIPSHQSTVATKHLTT